jgi:hypothetical protein
MKLRTSLLALGTIAGIPIAADAGTTVNFHYAHNYAATSTGGFSDIVYSGQGAYADPGNNKWNGFGPTFSADTGPNKTSDNLPTPITFALGPDQSANGGIWQDQYSDGAGGNNKQGTPFFLLGYATLVNAGNPGNGTTASPMGTFTLSHVPTGTYDIYLYGANYDSDRGAQFAMSSGTPDSALSATLNNHNNNTFVEGQNYVLFHNVTPNGSGIITGSFIPLFNPNTGQDGEADFNGLQIVSVSTPEPASLAVISLGSVFLLRRRRQ